MALPLANNAEGGTAGVTVSTANSGGASGDAWDVVAIGASETLTYDATNPAHGSGLDDKLGTFTTVTAVYVSWTTSLGTLSTNQRLAGRIYWVPPVAPPGSSNRVVQILNGSTILCTIYHASGTGFLEIHNSAGTLVGSASNTSLTAGTLYRIEFDFTGIGTAASGAGTVRLFVGDSTTQTGTDATCSAANFGTLAPDTVRFGITTANGNVSSNYYADAIQLNSTGMPGPESTGPPPPAYLLPTRSRFLPRDRSVIYVTD